MMKNIESDEEQQKYLKSSICNLITSIEICLIFRVSFRSFRKASSFISIKSAFKCATPASNNQKEFTRNIAAVISVRI